MDLFYLKILDAFCIFFFTYPLNTSRISSSFSAINAQIFYTVCINNRFEKNTPLFATL